jgi:transposase-like protein
MERTQTMNTPMNFNRTLMGSTGALRADVLPIKVAPAGASESPKPDPEVCSGSKPRRRFTAAYKLRILQKADACTEPGQIGALLRREGIYSSNLTTWRKQREKGILDSLAPKKRGRKQMEKNPLSDVVAKLQKENQRLKDKLNKAEMIIEVQKKISEILGLSPLNEGDI